VINGIWIAWAATGTVVALAAQLWLETRAHRHKRTQQKRWEQHRRRTLNNLLCPASGKHGMYGYDDLLLICPHCNEAWVATDSSLIPEHQPPWE
jgi:hypothetical protein